MIGKEFGRLTVIKKSKVYDYGKVEWVCKCKCGNVVKVLGVYLSAGDTQSCGCLKKDLEEINLREKYDEQRVDGVAMQLFIDEPRKDNSLGFKGVQKYYTRVSKEERYRAYITVKGKTYKKAGFMTPEDAYYNGRLALENEHLPKRRNKDD